MCPPGGRCPTGHLPDRSASDVCKAHWIELIDPSRDSMRCKWQRDKGAKELSGPGQCLRSDVPRGKEPQPGRVRRALGIRYLTGRKTAPVRTGGNAANSREAGVSC